MHPPPVLKKEIHLLQHHWLEFGQEWNSLERMDISSQRNQRNGYSGHCESVLIYSFSWNPSQLPAGGNSFAEIRWMRTICFPHIQHNSDLFLFHWLHLLLSTRGWHLLLTQQRKEEKTKPSTNNWSPMKNLYKVLSATCQIELQLVWLRCVLMKTTKKHNCLSRCVSLEIYAAQNIICLHYCVSALSHLSRSSRDMYYQPYIVWGRCRPPILSSPAHIPAWTHRTALSVTGVLREQQAVVDVYIQDGLRADSAFVRPLGDVMVLVSTVFFFTIKE